VKVVILGCGRVGSTIATTMSQEGHDVTIIDQNPDSFRRLAAEYSGKTLVGNGLDPDTLSKADIEHADAFVAVTNGDNRNIMSVQIAKVKFKVPKVVARIYDPIRSSAYADMGIETICTTCFGAGLMHDKILGKPFADVNSYCEFGMQPTGSEVAHG
jgi:trk system potassium uptake protein TrkA